MKRPGVERMIIYDGVGQPWFDAAAVAAYLARWLPWLELELRPGLLRHVLGHAPAAETLAGLAEDLCQARVRHPMRQAAGRKRRTLAPELDYETRLLVGRARPAAGVLYDGLELQSLAFNVLPEAERHKLAVHLWFTERLIATWDDADRRYHARVSLYGFPSIISTEGMVQAPARERAYYVARRLGLEQHHEAGEQALHHHDPRATEVAKGYAMQALFYAFTGEPFCQETNCRLFNAHWQSEMLAAQLGGSEFCPRHARMLEAWQAGPRRITEGHVSC